MGGGILLVGERLEWLLGAKWELEAAGLEVTATESVAEGVLALGAAPGGFGLVLVARPLVLGSAAALAASAGEAPVLGFPGTPALGLQSFEADDDGEYAELLPNLAEAAPGLASKFALSASGPPASGWAGPFNPLALDKRRVLHVTSADKETCRFLGVVLEAAGLVYTQSGSLPPGFESQGFDCLLTSCSGLGVSAAKEAAAAGLPVVAFGEDEASARDFAEPLRDAAPSAIVLPFPPRRQSLLEGIYKAANATNPEPPADLALLSAPPPPLDLSELLEQFEGDWEFMRDLLTCFLDEGVKRMEKLLEAVCAANIADVKFVSHTMKGSSRSCCLMRIGDLFADVDALSKQNMHADGSPPPHLLQSLTLLISLSQQSFLHTMDFDYGLQHLQMTCVLSYCLGMPHKVLDVPTGLEASEGNWDDLSSQLVQALKNGLSAVSSQSAQGVSSIVELSLIEFAAPELYNSAMDVLEFGDESYPALEASLGKLKSDMCLLMGKEAVP